MVSVHPHACSARFLPGRVHPHPRRAVSAFHPTRIGRCTLETWRRLRISEGARWLLERVAHRRLAATIAIRGRLAASQNESRQIGRQTNRSSIARPNAFHATQRSPIGRPRSVAYPGRIPGILTSPSRRRCDCRRRRRVYRNLESNNLAHATGIAIADFSAIVRSISQLNLVHLGITAVFVRPAMPCPV